MHSLRLIPHGVAHIAPPGMLHEMDGLGRSEWERVAAEAIRQGGGFVAFKPRPKPTAEAVKLRQLEVGPGVQLQPTALPVVPAAAPQVVPVADRKPKSLFSELFPFFAATVGIPLIVWFMSPEREQKRRARRA